MLFAPANAIPLLSASRIVDGSGHCFAAAVQHPCDPLDWRGVRASLSHREFDLCLVSCVFSSLVVCH